MTQQVKLTCLPWHLNGQNLNTLAEPKFSLHTVFLRTKTWGFIKGFFLLVLCYIDLNITKMSFTAEVKQHPEAVAQKSDLADKSFQTKDCFNMKWRAVWTQKMLMKLWSDFWSIPSNGTSYVIFYNGPNLVAFLLLGFLRYNPRPQSQIRRNNF